MSASDVNVASGVSGVRRQFDSSLAQEFGAVTPTAKGGPALPCVSHPGVVRVSSPVTFRCSCVRGCRLQLLVPAAVSGVVLSKEGEEIRHRRPGVCRVPQVGPLFDPVLVGASLAGVGEIPVLLQIRNDLLDGPLGELASRGDVADAGGAVLGDRGQHAGVIGQERPACM